MKSIKPRTKRKSKLLAPIFSEEVNGTLIIVGGNEDKEGDLIILKEIAKKAAHGKLIVATVASEIPMEMWAIYHRIFKNLGVSEIEHLNVHQAEEARAVDAEALFDGAKVFFFTGGDQLRITTKLGGSPIIEQVFKLFRSGGTIAGTSAGAAVMGKTMLIGKEENSESHKVGNWSMAPGLGLLDNILVDQHFAQRGRIGRLLGAVSMNPGILGTGVDENTAVIVTKNQLKVVGENAVYIVDGSGITYTNVSEASAENTMSCHGVRLHILSDSQIFDLKIRQPVMPQRK